MQYFNEFCDEDVIFISTLIDRISQDDATQILYFARLTGFRRVVLRNPVDLFRETLLFSRNPVHTVRCVGLGTSLKAITCRQRKRIFSFICVLVFAKIHCLRDQISQRTCFWVHILWSFTGCGWKTLWTISFLNHIHTDIYWVRLINYNVIFTLLSFLSRI